MENMGKVEYISVGKNKIKVKKIVWYKLYDKKDLRIVGQANDFYFIGSFPVNVNQTLDYAINLIIFRPLRKVMVEFIVPFDISSE